MSKQISKHYSNEIILNINSVSKNYYQANNVVSILKDINLTAKNGEIICIIGASGSGKSTFLHIAGLLDSPDTGEVSIIDTEKFKSAGDIRLNYIGFIYQYHHLLRDFTALENVAMPLLLQGYSKIESHERSRKLLDTLNMGNKINNVSGELSGGEQQRVAIARSMIHNPKIILADEPTGNLDPYTAENVFDMLIDKTRKNNTATIVVTHNMALAKRMDKIYKLDDGVLRSV